MQVERAERTFLIGAIATTAVLFFLAALFRHTGFASNLFDLGIFDQGLYLISAGLPPVVTTLHFPMLGDHGAFILYPLALLYRLFPHVGWLFAVQAIALSLGAWPLYALARREGLSVPWSRAVALSYLLYPAVFNIALFDFHPEVLALPALLWAVWAGLERNPLQLALAVLIALSCKEVLALTIAGLGIWLLVEGRRGAGVSLLLAGLGGFFAVSKVLIPALTHREPAAMARYAYLGHSMGEAALHVLRHPVALAMQVLTPDALLYLFWLVFPLFLALRWRSLSPLLPALPMLALNLLSTEPTQRNLVHHYSLPILPFLFVWLVRSLGHWSRHEERSWLKPRWLVASSLVGFLALAKFGYFWGLYQVHATHLTAIRQAIAAIHGSGGVLAASDFCPHLTQRRTIEMLDATQGTDPDRLAPYEYVLLDLDHAAWRTTSSYSQELFACLKDDARFHLAYSREGIVLFARVAPPKTAER